MKKGFTLVELLAVIVILSIIAIITIPMIKGVIDKVKMKSLEDSVYGLKSAAELYFSSNEKLETTEFICNGSACTSSSNKKLSFKGKVNGRVKLFSDGKVSICLTSDNYASSIIASEKKATTKMGGCDEETYEISEVIAIEKYNEVKNDFLSVKNTLYNKTLISNVDNDVNTINEEINSINIGIDKEQVKNDLYNSLQYSGLVTEDMTYDEILTILKNKFPEYEDVNFIDTSPSLWIDDYNKTSSNDKGSKITINTNSNISMYAGAFLGYLNKIYDKPIRVTNDSIVKIAIKESTLATGTGKYTVDISANKTDWTTIISANCKDGIFLNTSAYYTFTTSGIYYFRISLTSIGSVALYRDPVISLFKVEKQIN